MLSLLLLPFSDSLAARGPKSQFGSSESGIQRAENQEGTPAQRLERYSRANYTWPYATGPFYGSVAGTDLQDSGVIITQVGTFRLGQPLNLPAQLMTTDRLSSVGAQYFIVSMDRTAVGAVVEAIEVIRANGGEIGEHLHGSSLIARLTPDAMSALSQMPSLYHVEPYHPAFKLDPSIGRTPLASPTKAISNVYDLELQVFKGEDSAVVAQAAARLGANVKAIMTDTVVVEADRSTLPALAALEPVQSIHEALPLHPNGEETTTVVQTGGYNMGATPFHDAGVDGSGGGLASAQVLMVLDSGFSLDAPDLGDDAGGGIADVTPLAGISGTHRKVLVYRPTSDFPFGGGDQFSCDAAQSGAFTHGHTVAATALGSTVDLGDGEIFIKDDNGNTWRNDGLAPGAMLIAHDGQSVPPNVSCGDPQQDVIVPGDLYTGSGTGALEVAYSQGARVFNFSWGSASNAYSSNASDIDTFLSANNANRSAMVFVSAGNAGQDANPSDGIPDLLSLGQPATTKNGLAIGASGGAGIQGTNPQESRAAFSSTGPAVSAVPNSDGRVAPQLMAPGQERSTLGADSEWSCKSNDNDQAGAIYIPNGAEPTICDRLTGVAGTSFASPAAAGAALLVRDYFAQGLYPDGRSDDVGNGSDQVADISGALVKSVLIASADFMSGANLTIPYRFNNEQGYGRIQLDKALPLSNWSPSPTGMIVVDGGITGGVKNLSGFSGALGVGVTESGTFDVIDPDEELRIAVSWIEGAGATVANDIDLTLVSPSGVTYYGNRFTDDDNRNNVVDPATEDCPDYSGNLGATSVQFSQWSYPVCTRANMTLPPRDSLNPTEAIYLSPDPVGNGSVQMTEAGTWTIQLTADGGNSGSQSYALAIVGGVGLQSSVQLDQSTYTCNQLAEVTVAELDDPADTVAALTEGEVSNRTIVEVLDSMGMVVDNETGLTFTKPDPAGSKFVATGLILTDGTERDPGNGVLDVRSGDRIRVRYLDELNGIHSADLERIGLASVDCGVALRFGDITFGQFGQDTTFFVAGGCERNQRGLFEFGFPDKYMDAEELISFNFAFASSEGIDLRNVEVDLRCVLPDADSPEDCLPNTGSCADPNRLNNPSCDGRVTGTGMDMQYMSILDTPKTIGLIPAGSAISANFSIAMNGSITGTPDVEMVLDVRAPTSGKTASGVAVSQHKLDVDELSLFYSTDFPLGGTEVRDYNNNEVEDNPTTNIGDFLEDYRFDTITWSNLTANGKNASLNAPWHFDTTPSQNAFASGIGASTDDATITDTIAQWGEDKNFNNNLDGICSTDGSLLCNPQLSGSDCPGVGAICLPDEDRDPSNNVLDRNVSAAGGCGWQSRAPGSCSGGGAAIPCYKTADCPAPFQPCNLAAPRPTGGIWHTGTIGSTSGACATQCQLTETVSGATGQKLWFEVLETPVVQKVSNDPDVKVEIVNFAWNQAIDIGDSNAAWSWEVDTDVATLEPVDTRADLGLLNFLFGGYGSVVGGNNPDLTDGYSVFAPFNDLWQTTLNGTVGKNRAGKNSCYFENNLSIDAIDHIGLPKPEDDDLDNDGDMSFDEYVEPNGPIRNMDLFAVNGPDMRFSTLEDFFGDTGATFKGAIGLLNFEKETSSDPDPTSDYGIGVDDVVMQWREVELVQDTTLCTTGECAVIDVQTSNFFEGNSLIEVTVLEKSPDAANDCDLDGSTDGTQDCDGNGTNDVVVRATSLAEPAGEILFLNATGNANEYKGFLPVSASYDSPGVLFLQPAGADNPDVTVTYFDNDDGAGNLCQNDVDPANWGRVEVDTTLFFTTGTVIVLGTALTDNDDNDGFADTSETVDMQIRITNKTGIDLSNVVARLATNDPKIDCIIQPTINIGDVAADATMTTTGAFKFRVADSADRTTAGLGTDDPYDAVFTVVISADEFNATASPQSVSLALDLDASGGGSPTTVIESFENGFAGQTGGAAFQINDIDDGRRNFPNSDGYRCQYANPEWVQSNSYGAITDCYLGTTFSDGSSFWAISDAGDNDGGRAYSGTQSLRFNFDLGADGFTTPYSVIEAAETVNPINLGLTNLELSFKHQIQLVDEKSVGPLPGARGADRGVVHAQLADVAGNPVGSWIKLTPYTNVYDKQAADNFTNCTFDPVDDGNDEDDYFDPADPFRRLGPSSTCFPEYSFVYQGDTFNPFNEASIGFASDGPGLPGSLGVGTWIESKFALEQFKARRVRVRFLETAIKLGNTAHWEQAFVFNPDPGDDGWFIDDVTVTGALTSPVTLLNDDVTAGGLPTCGVPCNFVTSDLAADPVGALPAPGQVVELSAAASVADRCLNGTLQYQYWIDGNGDNLGGNAADTLVRGWTDNADLISAPAGPTTYVVDVRCSSATTCVDSTSVFVDVLCPSSGNLGGAFPTVVAPNKTTLDWGSSINYDFAQGLLSNVSTYGTTATGQNQGPASTYSIAATPTPGTGNWFLFRTPGPLGSGGGSFCNSGGASWGSAARDAVLP